MKITVKHRRAAIVGYWRSGAKLRQISELTGFSLYKIEQIINNHKNKDNEHRNRKNRQQH
jgi:hypothetical protein